MRSNVPSFYNFIKSLFGLEARDILRKWSRVHISLIQIRERIRFLRNYKRFKLLPPHLSSLFNNSISFSNNKSSLAYDNVKSKTALRVLNIEIADAFRSLRRYRHTELQLAIAAYNFIPSYILDNYCNRQSRFFQHVFASERRRMDGKLGWMIARKHKTSAASLSFSYYCNFAPKTGKNIYKRNLKRS